MGEGIVRESEMDRHKLKYLKRITCKDLLRSTGSSVLCGSLCGRGVWGRMDSCTCKAAST